MPIITDETLKQKDRALIHEDKIVCHPDLVERVIEGLSLLRASAEGFEKDMKKLEEEDETKANNGNNENNGNNGNSRNPHEGLLFNRD